MVKIELILFYFALIFFFWRFNLFFPYHSVLNPYVTVMSIIAGTYVSIFLIFMLIKNYEEIKLILEKVQFKITSLVVVKHTNSKFDFTKFFLFSILITFSIDIILTKISQQSIIEYILGNIPGLGDTATTIGYDPKSSLVSSQSPSDKFENVKDALGQFIGPSVGAIILFF